MSTYDGNPTRTKLKMLSQNKGLPYELHDSIWEDKQQLTIQMINDLEPSDRKDARLPVNPKEVAQIAGPNNNNWRIS